jgi:hypothetical protein
MMMLWAWAGVPLGVYNIVEDFNIALRIQPQILTLLSLVTWIQCYYYEKATISVTYQVIPDADINNRTGLSYALLPLWSPLPASWAVSRQLLSSPSATPRKMIWNGR